MTYKVAVAIHTVSGAEGSANVVTTVAKLPLFFGFDVVGAVMVAAVTYLVGKLVPARWQSPGDLLSAAVCGLYAFVLIVSFHVNRIQGAPLDKAAIDLAFFNTEPHAGVTGSGAMSESISIYLSRGICFQLVLVPLAAGGLTLLLLRRQTLCKAIRRPVIVVSVATGLVTIGILPFLRNGEIGGIRVHSYGLERSPGPLLANSYLRSWLKPLLTSKKMMRDPFCLDNASTLGPRALDVQPLLQAKPRQTNVLIVLLESVRANEQATMPFLRDLASQPGVATFKQHYSHWPQTMKSIFSLLCSEHPYPEYPPITHVNPSIPCATLFSSAKQAGYRTAWFMSGDLSYDRMLRFLKHRDIDEIQDMHSIPRTSETWHNSWGIDEKSTIGALFNWIDRRVSNKGPRPFLAVYNMAAGHHPYEFPGSTRLNDPSVQEEDRAYSQVLTYIDDNIEEVWKQLRLRGLDRETLLVIVSDHGPKSGRPGTGAARDPTIYEGSIHVPLIVAGPQLGDGTLNIDYPTGHVDLAPTVLALASLPIPYTMKGRDLTHSRAATPILFGTRPPTAQFGLRDRNMKLVYSAETDSSELFDLAKDPNETLDVAAERPGQVAAMLNRVQTWRVHGSNLIENYAAILAKRGAVPCP